MVPMSKIDEVPVCVVEVESAMIKKLSRRSLPSLKQPIVRDPSRDRCQTPEDHQSLPLYSITSGFSSASARSSSAKRQIHSISTRRLRHCYAMGSPSSLYARMNI